jgi:hypothetical protein
VKVSYYYVCGAGINIMCDSSVCGVESFSCVLRDLNDSGRRLKPRPLLSSLFPDLAAHSCSHKLKGKELYQSFSFYAYGNSNSTERTGRRVLPKWPSTSDDVNETSDEVFCGMCGCKDIKKLMQHSCIPRTRQRVTFFCGDKDCFDQYRYCAINYYDLTYGIPRLWEDEARKNSRLYCAAPDKLTKLRCAYCNEGDENVVVYHPLILSWYQHNVFCKNSTCCKRYVSFVEDVPRIPFVFESRNL